MKTHYELLGIPPTANPEDVKRAFRREIARYHPDKVQHLGMEFQEIAATRAAALTDAYRVLMDPELRARYDAQLAEGVAAPDPAPAPPPAPEPPPTVAPDPASPPPIDRRFTKEQASTTEFVRRAVAAKLKEAVGKVGGVSVAAGTFDAVFHIKGRKPLFRKPEPAIRLAVRIAASVDAAAIQDAWAPALRIPAADEILCLLLLGSEVAPARDLAAAVSELRRRTRKTAPVVVPVDVRDWEALFPPETPAVVRILLERLRQGE